MEILFQNFFFVFQLIAAVHLVFADHRSHDALDGITQNILGSSVTKDPITPLYESAEHQRIGDLVTLHYDSENVTGKNFNYSVQGTSIQLSYGLVIALAGDFYANWTTGSGCATQISDFWNQNPAEAVLSVLELAGWLATNKFNYLPCILKRMEEQRREVLDGVKKGQDPAQVYTSISGKYDKQYTYCTNGGYVWIAECNWDHFGIDAQNAYSAGHIAALQQALVAHKSQNQSDLEQAYFLEAFAQHYLTDLFAAGHQRTPRRVLHRNFWGDIPENPEIPDLYPADLCAQKMHNEDNANGLWVNNRLGESWASYGDKQLFTAKGAESLRHAVMAAQSGIDEVWTTYQTGNMPDPDFEALKRAPIILDSYPGYALNFRAMFQDVPAQGVIFMRQHVDDRDNFSQLVEPAIEGFSQWKQKLNHIQNSGEDIYMYPYSQPFESRTDMVLMTTPLFSDVIVSTYGEVDSGSFGKTWGMKHQTYISTPTWLDETYVTTTRLGDSNSWIYSNVIRIGDESGSGEKTRTRHTGLNLKNFSVAWDDVFFDTENVEWNEGETTYGVFSNDTTDLAMLKYWHQDSKNSLLSENARLELYTLPANLQSPPQKQGLEWAVTPLNFMLSYLFPGDSNPHFLAYGHDANTKKTFWYVSSWSGGYATQSVAQYDEVLRFPAQALLTAKLQSSDQSDSIVRLFYGQSFPIKSSLRIDILVPSLSSSNEITFTTNVTTVVTIPLGVISTESYLTWFIEDVNGDGYADLVTLINPTSALNVELNVVVFPGTSNGTFGAPVVSPISLDSSKGTLLTAAFMSSVKVHRAEYVYPATNETSKASILAVFDNFGIIGVRMLAPVQPTGSYQYEFKGQVPAVAGQSLNGMKWHAPDWMSRQERRNAIGVQFPPPISGGDLLKTGHATKENSGYVQEL